MSGCREQRPKTFTCGVWFVESAPVIRVESRRLVIPVVSVKTVRGTLPISAVPIKWLDCDEGYNLPGPCLVGQLVPWKWVISGLMHIIKISWVSMVIESN